jgi:hypothetical protein
VDDEERTHLEKVVAGTAMTQPGKFPALADLVTGDMFTHQPARIVWEQLEERIPKGLPIHHAALSKALGKDGLRRIGGPGTLGGLVALSLPDAEWHAEQIREEALRDFGKRDLYQAIQRLDEAEDVIGAIDDTVLKVAALQRRAAESGVKARHSRRLVLTPASQIPVKPVRWMWDTTPEGEPPTSQGRIPMFSLALAAGGAGLGKSQFAVWATARITRGELPGELRGRPRAVIYAATEDSWTYTIAPRLIAAGADMDLVFRVDVLDDGAASARLTLPVDTTLLGKTAEEYGVALVVADPLLSMIDASINDYRAAEVRAALEPLVAAADRHGFTILGLAHFTKNGSADPLTRVAGSGAFGQLIRALIAFARVELDDGTTEMILSQEKNNLGREGMPSFQYVIQPVTVETDDGAAHVSRFVLGPQTEHSVRQAMRDESDGHDEGRSECAEWLRGYLLEHVDGALRQDVMKAGKGAGFSESTVSRAKRKLRIVARQGGFGEAKGSLWFLPETAPPRGEGE